MSPMFLMREYDSAAHGTAVSSLTQPLSDILIVICFSRSCAMGWYSATSASTASLCCSSNYSSNNRYIVTFYIACVEK
jgi:hypothetical protein